MKIRKSIVQSDAQKVIGRRRLLRIEQLEGDAIGLVKSATISL